jgi:hypothetical protein
LEASPVDEFPADELPAGELNDSPKGGPVISRTLLLSAALLLFPGVIPSGRAQDTSAAASPSQSDSLGDAARKARAEKPRPAKPAKVLTNDDVHGLKDSFRQKSHGKQTSPSSSAKPQSQR